LASHFYLNHIITFFFPHSGFQRVLPIVEQKLDECLKEVYGHISPFFLTLVGGEKRRAFEARLQQFVAIENIHNSTALEGNTLTRQQVIDVLAGKQVSSARGARDTEEVLGLFQATNFLVSNLRQQNGFTLPVISIWLGSRKRRILSNSCPN
jgi:hypothetical protein